MGKHGLDRVILNEALAGDIVSIAGFPKSTVTMTLCDPEVTKPVPVCISILMTSSLIQNL